MVNFWQAISITHLLSAFASISAKLYSLIVVITEYNYVVEIDSFTIIKVFIYAYSMLMLMHRRIRWLGRSALQSCNSWLPDSEFPPTMRGYKPSTLSLLYYFNHVAADQLSYNIVLSNVPWWSKATHVRTQEQEVVATRAPATMWKSVGV